MKTNGSIGTAAAIAFVLLSCFAATIAQETWSGFAGTPPQRLSGVIKWKKTLGTVPFTTGLSAPHSDPCMAFHVLVVTADEDQTLLKAADALVWKPKAGEFNVCEFELTVPSNTAIRVYPIVGRRSGMSDEQYRLYLRGGWSGGEKPETGYKRGFTRSYYEVTLNPTKPMYIGMEMSYILNRFGNPPRYSDPPPSPPKTPYIAATQVIFPVPGHLMGFVVLSWDAGPDHPNAEVSVKINGSADIPIAKQPKGGRQVNVERGRSYTYFLTDGGRILSSVVFIAQ